MNDATKKPLAGAAKASAEAKAAKTVPPLSPEESNALGERLAAEEAAKNNPPIAKRSILSGSILEGGLF